MQITVSTRRYKAILPCVERFFNRFHRCFIAFRASLSASLRPFGFRLSYEFLSTRQGDFAFDAALLQIDLGGHQGQPLLLHLADELSNLVGMEQEACGFPERFVVLAVAELVGADMAVEQPEFAVANRCEAVFEIDLSGADRFDFRALED